MGKETKDTGDAAVTITQERALLGICSVVRGLLAGAARDEVLARRQVGDVLRKVKRAPDSYGTRAMERISEEIGIAVRELYRYVDVAENWSEEELKTQLEKTNRHGHPLTWTYFLVLTKAKNDAARVRLVDACLTNAWTAKGLEQRIDNAAAASNGTRNSDAAHTGEIVHAALKEGIQTSGRMLAELRLFDEALDSRLSTVEEPVDERLLSRTVASFEEIQEQIASTIARLRGASESQRRLRVRPDRVNREGARGDEMEDDVEATVPSIASRGARFTRK